MIAQDLQKKWDALLSVLSRLDNLAVAFSGGVDSGLLAAAAWKTLGGRMTAFMIHSSVEDDEALRAAQLTASEAGFPLEIVPFDDLELEEFKANPVDRCYFCKRRRFTTLLEIARERGFESIAEGSNADDNANYRPGSRAAAELKVLSPLEEAGLTKSDIRQLAKWQGLSIWDRPSAPCLATRFPYGVEITREGIERIADAERWLRGQGFRQIRVRDYGKMARIELDPVQISMAAARANEIDAYFAQLGYRHTALDLRGYRSGSLDEGINKP